MTKTVADFWRVWLVRAPWAHPHWSDYMISVVDLTSKTAEPPVIYLPGATHEVLVFALDPTPPNSYGEPRCITDEDEFKGFAKRCLQPANYGFQVSFPSDGDCEAWLQSEVIDAIGAQRLNPDTDARWQWRALFAGGFSLLNGEGLLPSRHTGN